MTDDLDEIELALFIEGVYRCYGYDFRDYARASLKRRVTHCARQENVETISALQDLVLHDPAAMHRFLQALTVDTTAMFRDPGFYAAFRRLVVPLVRDLPFIRLWDMGCSSGEETYSLAILFLEEGLSDKCRIYATDLNETSLEKAKAGIYALDHMQVWTSNYQKAGGREDFSRYYTTRYKNALFSADLKKNLLFAVHNLVSDASFNEFHVIVCRNVMIYFNQALQERTHRLLHDSLAKDGILGLGSKETIQFTPHESCYEVLDEREKLFRKGT